MENWKDVCLMCGKPIVEGELCQECADKMDGHITNCESCGG